MSVVKQFECSVCGASGKILLKGNNFEYESIELCPVCGSNITDEDDYDEYDDE